MNKSIKYYFGDSGQSLIELLVALTLIVIVIVAVVGLAAISIKTAYFAKKNTMAKRYAEQALEWLRGEARGNWYNLLTKADSNSNNTDYCLNNLDFNTAGACNDYLDNIYKRELKLYKDESEPQKPKIKVTVLVSWKDNIDHSVEVSSVFTSPD